jgi:hypothetical protein
MQQGWSQHAKIQSADISFESAAKFIKDIDAIAAFDYIPSLEHVLQVRVRTSGLIEEKYLIDGTEFVMYDVGGQRNERKKWIHCFDDVNAVIFVAAISEYDQVLFEENAVNRMVEAIQLFEEICNSRWFTRTDMILFLNKKDLFEEKLESLPINAVDEFKDFDGPAEDFEAGKEYFLQKFLQQNKNQEKEIFHHVTCATDSQNVEVVFNAAKEIILKTNLAGSGFM